MQDSASDKDDGMNDEEMEEEKYSVDISEEEKKELDYCMYVPPKRLTG